MASVEQRGSKYLNNRAENESGKTVGGYAAPLPPPVSPALLEHRVLGVYESRHGLIVSQTADYCAVARPLRRMPRT